VRLVTVKVPEVYLEGIDELVKLGRYSSRSEVIRTAIRDLLKKELWFPEEELNQVRKFKDRAASNIKVLKVG